MNSKKEKCPCSKTDKTAHPLLNSTTSNKNKPTGGGGGGRKQTPLERFAEEILNFKSEKKNKEEK